jgi:hypothetical protein
MASSTASTIRELRYDRAVERRQHERYRLWIPVEIDSEDGSSWPGVIHDVSETGALAVTSATFKVGVKVTVRLNVPPDGSEEKRHSGEITRVGLNGADPDSLWKKEIAIQFDEPVAELDAFVKLGEKIP